ncbi:hypothetical protein J4E85_002911 [Alternaria conjuncta]|uniref:uncharacterized protein n=1 Tax=Alternaria conjuncta TaxID=181017 RepID=UPI00221F4866|nr:uncharacterized protein J4E85_002911 [Alternaria conjuncta]KAI4932513.1 hypothetical protein J4E85_002911 [Alternaria conjuncta]
MAFTPVARPSGKFAHWNTFPFMTAPKTKYYSAQLQSPLFRLPREVRDVIYEYYLLENDGYHYDSEIDKLLYHKPSISPKQVVRLGLRITCRIAAEEMRDSAIGKIHFYPKRSFNDGKEYMNRQKCRILVCAAELLHPDDLVDIDSQFPTVKHWFHAPLNQAVTHRTDELGTSDDSCKEVLSQSFSDALQHALVLAKNRHPSRFAELTRETFGLGDCPIRSSTLGFVQNNLFVQGALSDIYHWHPTPWSIPGDKELSKLERLICEPGDLDNLLPTTDEGVFYFPDITEHFHAARYRWYFSAAAVAIEFCSDYVSGYEEECIYSEDCFEVLIPWIEEALLLPSLGMPVQSFQLVVDGDARESSEFWHMLKYAAATQQARYRGLQLNGIDLPTGELRPMYDGDYAVWDFPSGFASMVRDICQGNSIVRYNGDVGELWDEDKFFSERKDWTELQWETDWNETIDQGIVSNFWPKVSERYLKGRSPY